MTAIEWFSGTDAVNISWSLLSAYVGWTFLAAQTVDFVGATALVVAFGGMLGVALNVITRFGEVLVACMKIWAATKRTALEVDYLKRELSARDATIASFQHKVKGDIKLSRSEGDELRQEVDSIRASPTFTPDPDRPPLRELPAPRPAPGPPGPAPGGPATGGPPCA